MTPSSWDESYGGWPLTMFFFQNLWIVL